MYKISSRLRRSRWHCAHVIATSER